MIFPVLVYVRLVWDLPAQTRRFAKFIRVLELNTLFCYWGFIQHEIRKFVEDPDREAQPAAQLRTCAAAHLLLYSCTTARDADRSPGASESMTPDRVTTEPVIKCN